MPTSLSPIRSGSPQEASVREEQLLTDMLSYACDPAGFVCYAFPWEEAGTALEHESGPDGWQLEVLDYLGRQMVQTADPLRLAVASGHGPGKSTLLAWLVLWFMSTKPTPQITVTASTANQLSTKTWRELAKWWGLALNKHWFTWTASRFYRNTHPTTWYASAIPWSKEKAQSFAGTHERYVLIAFDEASTIADEIWEVTDGAMSTPGAIWIALGNPEQASGRFRDCFGRFRGLWHTWEIDSRTAKMTDKAEIARQIEAYGLDSDFVRVRWLGKFPRQGPTQFISETLVEAAQQRTVPPDAIRHAPKILGVDVARYGPNETVLTLRQGLSVVRWQGFRGLRTDETADVVAAWLTEDPEIQTVFVDSVGLGAGVVDQLWRLGWKSKVLGINSGEAATELLPGSQRPKYFNLRAQMWGQAKDWLEAGGCLPPAARQLGQDLVAPKFGFAREQQIQLERKEDMALRNIPSPDYADSFVLTFARPVAPRLIPRQRPVGRQGVAGGWMA